MLLNNLLKASVVQLSEASQIMDIGNDVAQILLQQHKVFLERDIVLSTARLIGSVLMLVCLGNDGVDFCFAGLDPLDNLLTLDLLEGEDLVQLSLELLHEPLLILFRPRLPLRLRIVLGGRGDVVGLEGVLQAIIVDVVVVPILYQRRLELVTEPVCPAKPWGTS